MLQENLNSHVSHLNANGVRSQLFALTDIKYLSSSMKQHAETNPINGLGLGPDNTR